MPFVVRKYRHGLCHLHCAFRRCLVQLCALLNGRLGLRAECGGIGGDPLELLAGEIVELFEGGDAILLGELARMRPEPVY